ncbi:MAG: lamin tail domain-containing protein [Anaerolineaceae bacterium]
MNPWKRLLFFLILNVIVSAGTTVAVMSWWERAHLDSRATIVSSTHTAGQEDATAKPAGTAVPTPTPLPPNDIPLIRIENVFGVSDLQNEVVLLKRIGDGELWLTGWRLEDESGQKYIFPDLLLNKDGAIQVFTRPGVDSVIELHWGMKAAVWQPGELVTLVDPLGNVRATYRIP